MKTKDIVKTGIDRNFLRECIDHNLITPERINSLWINNENYRHHRYTQKDLEIVWNAYLCRKMGLSYDEIKELTNGVEFHIRTSLNKLIEKYENKIEEYKAIISFMKYVKGLGFIPAPPAELMGSKSFKDYLIDFMEYLDKDKKIKKTLDLAEYVSSIDNLEHITDEEIREVEIMTNELSSGITQEVSNAYSSAILSLKDKTQLNPEDDEVQTIIQQIFYYQKKISGDNKLSVWDFSTGFSLTLSSDSDLAVMYRKVLGTKTVEFIIDALDYFLIANDPRIIRIIEKEQNRKG